MLEQSVPDYLAFGTRIAQTSKHEFDNAYPVRDGYTQLPSRVDRVITYYLVNPQAYTRNVDVTFPDTVTVSSGSVSLRDFGSYSIPIMVNSVLAPVSSPVALRGGTSEETYVICFNLPDMSGSNINRNIVNLEIGAPYNRAYMINTVGTLSGGGSEIQTVYNEDW